MKKESRKKYLFKNTIIFALGNFASKFITFFLIPLYTNFLTTDEYGTIDLLTVLCTMIIPIVTLNIIEAIIRFALDKNADIDKITSTGLICLFISTILTIIAIPILNNIESLKDYSLLFYLYVITMSYSQFFLSLLRGKEKLLQYSIGNIIHTLLIGIFNIIFLTIFDKGIEGYFYAFIISNIVTSIYAFIINNTINSIKKFNFDKKLSKEMIKYSVVLIPNSFMWWIMNSLDRVMITSMIGATANGIYSVSYKIPSLMTTITTIFNQAWSYSAIKEEESDDKEEYSNNIFNNLFKTVIIISVLILLILKPFLKLYVGSDFYSAWKYVPFLIIGFVFMTLGTFLATSYTVNKDSMGYVKSATVGTIINLVLNFILIKQIGIAGAAIATAISYISVFVFRLFDIKKYLQINIKKKEYFIGIIVLLFASASIYIDNYIGYILLLLESIFILFIFKETWLSLINSFISKIMKKTKIKSKEVEQI